MSDEEPSSSPTKDGKEEDMEVDSKKEEKPDKGAGGDHDSDDEHDKSTESEEQNDKPVKDDKPSASPPKSKTPKKPKKVEAKVKDSGDEDETSEEKTAWLERPTVVTGKRERKKVERMEYQSTTPKEKKLEVPEGKGETLGEIPNVEFRLGKTHSEDLKPLHRLVYGRSGSANEVKKNLRKFCGFGFNKDSPEYTKKATALGKYTVAQLKSTCEILDIERGGTKESVVTRILEFLLKPASSGKALLADKKRKRSSSGKKGKAPRKKGEKGKKDVKKKKPKKKASGDSEEEDSESEEDDDAEEDKDDESDAEGSDDQVKKPKSVANKKKKPKKKTEEDGDDDEDEEEEEEDAENSEDEEPKKKKAKTQQSKEKKPEKVSPKKKEDSDSGSDDDEPLVKQKSPKPPSDDELKKVIKDILDGANLEEVTMKTVCKQVFAKYEQFDLTDRKDFIKSTVREIIR